MQHIRLTFAILFFLLFGKVQGQKIDLNLLLLNMIENDSGKIRPEINAGIFFDRYSDETRDIKWNALEFGVKNTVQLGVFIVYGKFFVEKYKEDNLNYGFHSEHTEPNLEFGGGISLNSPFSEKFGMRGSLTSSFDRFNPEMDFEAQWKLGKIELSMGDKILPLNASFFNPTATILYRIY